MVISEEKITKLYRAFSDPIIDLRIENSGGMSIEDMDDRLCKLEQEIFKRIKSVLNLKRSGE